MAKSPENAQPAHARTDSPSEEGGCRAPEGGVRTVAHEIPGWERVMKVYVSYPAGYPARNVPPLPWLLYLHQGGFVEGCVQEAEWLTGSLAAAVPAIVITPEYALAPAHPFPAAPEDAFRAVEWALRNARKLKIDKPRYGVVGEEAGGNIAIAVGQMLRDRGLPMPMAQWLIRPVTDPCLQHASCPLADAPAVSLETLQRLAGNYREYLPTPAATVHPYAAPALASRLGGLPPALIQVAERDALRAEGEAFVQKLISCGVSAEAMIMPGACGSGVEESHDSCQVWLDEGARFLRQHLAGDDDASHRTERRSAESPQG